jgi:hypothetical protein
VLQCLPRVTISTETRPFGGRCRFSDPAIHSPPSVERSTNALYSPLPRARYRAIIVVSASRLGSAIDISTLVVPPKRKVRWSERHQAVGTGSEPVKFGHFRQIADTQDQGIGGTGWSTQLPLAALKCAFDILHIERTLQS